MMILPFISVAALATMILPLISVTALVALASVQPLQLQLLELLLQLLLAFGLSGSDWHGG
jgi:hypothetical protein